MLCHSVDTDTGWQNCGSSRASVNVLSDGIAFDRLNIRMVSLLNVFSCVL